MKKRSGIPYIASSIGVLALAALVLIPLSNSVFKDSDPNAVSGIKHYSASELPAQAADKFSWKIYWTGPRASTEYELTEPAVGAARITYLVPGSIDAPDQDFFYVQTFKDEAARLAYPRRVKPFNKVTETSPGGNQINYQTSDMTAVLVYLKDGGIVGVNFPSPQSVDTLRSTADSLVPLA